MSEQTSSRAAMKFDRARNGFIAFAGSVFASWLASRIDQNPATIIAVGTIVLVLIILAFYFRFPGIMGSYFDLQAVVVSVVVFDGTKVLLLKDDEPPSWLVPPSAHVGCFSDLKGAPHEAVIHQVRNDAGINIQIDDPPDGPGGRGATPIAVPFYAQSEPQFSFREGHAIHHDFYYLGRLIDEQRKPRGNYEWIEMSALDERSTKVPKEMKAIIDIGFKQWKRLNRA